MKIVTSCDDKPKEVKCGDIEPGTVFRYCDHKLGPYLRVTNGIVMLSVNRFISYEDDYIFTDFKELPNTKLVTGENDE